MKGSRFCGSNTFNKYNADGSAYQGVGVSEVRPFSVELLKTRFKEMGLDIDPEAGRTFDSEEIKRLLLNH